MTNYSVEYEDGTYTFNEEYFQPYMMNIGCDTIVPDSTPFYLHPAFLNEHPELKTYGDLVTWLTSRGLTASNISTSARRYHLAPIILFNPTEERWEVQHPSLENECFRKCVVRGEGTSGESLLVDFEKPVTTYYPYDYSTREHPSGLYTYVSVLKPAGTFPQIGDGEPYFYQKNHYRFLPDSLAFMGYNAYHHTEVRERLYFGIEIEMYSKLSITEIQYIVESVEPKQQLFFYFKEDGSVRDGVTSGWNDYELVTHPMSPARMRREFRTLFKKIEALCAVKGLKVKQVFKTKTNCGIHVHVNSDSFNVMKGVDRKAYASSKAWKNKFASIWNLWDKKSTSVLEKIAGRTRNRYCDVHPDMVHKYLSYRLKAGARDINHNDRYSSCRETAATVEVRVFSSKFELDHILHCINSVQSIHEFSRDVPLSAIGPRFGPAYLDWLNKRPKYKTIAKEIAQCA